MSAAKIHVIVHQVPNAELTIMWQLASAYQVLLAMHTQDVHKFRQNQNHNVQWTQIVQVNWPVSATFAKIRATKPNHAVHVPPVQL